jgi:hypothetical protein
MSLTLRYWTRWAMLRKFQLEPRDFQELLAKWHVTVDNREIMKGHYANFKKTIIARHDQLLRRWLDTDSGRLYPDTADRDMTHEETVALLKEARVFFPSDVNCANPKVVRALWEPLDIMQDSQWKPKDEWFSMLRRRSYTYCSSAIRYVRKDKKVPTERATEL